MGLFKNEADLKTGLQINQINSVQFNSIPCTEHSTLRRKARPKVCCEHKSMTQNLLRAFLHDSESATCFSARCRIYSVWEIELN